MIEHREQWIYNKVDAFFFLLVKKEMNLVLYPSAQQTGSIFSCCCCCCLVFLVCVGWYISMRVAGCQPAGAARQTGA